MKKTALKIKVLNAFGDKKNIIDYNKYSKDRIDNFKSKSSKNLYNISTRSTLPTNQASIRTLSMTHNNFLNVPKSFTSIGEDSFNQHHKIPKSSSSSTRSADKNFATQTCQIFAREVGVIDRPNYYESPSMRKLNMVNLMPDYCELPNISLNKRRTKSIIKLEPIKESQTWKNANKSRRNSNHRLLVNKKSSNVKLDPLFINFN